MARASEEREGKGVGVYDLREIEGEKERGCDEKSRKREERGR